MKVSGRYSGASFRSSVNLRAYDALEKKPVRPAARGGQAGQQGARMNKNTG